MVLYDFCDPAATAEWSAINDAVMGGLSAGRASPGTGGTLSFEGDISLENNGGFASVRSDPGRWDLGGMSGIMIRFKGDGRRYKLNLRTDELSRGTLYRTPFETTQGEWQELRFPFDGFFAAHRGRPVPDAPPLDPSRITSVGLLISDKQAGPFRLEVERIEAYQEGDPGNER